MATAQDVINDATSHLRARRANTAYNTQDSDKNTDIFAALKNLIADLAERKRLNIPAPAATTDTLDIPDGDVRALGYILAVDISPQLGRTPSPVVIDRAEDGEEKLGSQSTLDLEADLTDIPGSTRGRYNINSDR